MELNGIFSISGKPGLFKLVSQSKGGVIVEGIEDGKKVHANAQAKISGLSDISVFSDTDDIPLLDVLTSMKEKLNGELCEINLSKEEKEMVALFTEVLPDYDRDRVYNSDIKKIFKWYNALHKAGIISEKEKEEVKEEKVAE